ncbi:CrcB family protein [bacterium]|nr:CrcB family protein [bacterium]
MKECIGVLIGGGIGAVLRYFICNVLQQKLNLQHWATFWVNITGCLTLGLLFEKTLAAGYLVHAFIVIGIIGSYTTFSAFEYENIDLIAHEKYLEFLKYSTFSCIFAFIAVACGFYLAKLI